jgi:hypothetical protein
MRYFPLLVMMGLVWGVASAGDGGVIADATVTAPNLEELVDKGKDAYGAVHEAMDAPTLATVMGAVSACLWALIALGRRFLPMALKGHTVRIITVIGGAAAALATQYAVEGVTIWHSTLVFLAGPGALAFNEVLKLLGINVKDAADDNKV